MNCSNCGAPVDLAKGGECAHCGSPLSMLDVKQAEVLVAALHNAGAGPQPVDKTALPLELARARQDVSDAFARFADQPNWFSSIEDAGTVGAAVGAFAAWLRGQLRVFVPDRSRRSRSFPSFPSGVRHDDQHDDQNHEHEQPDLDPAVGREPAMRPVTPFTST